MVWLVNFLLPVPFWNRQNIRRPSFEPFLGRSALVEVKLGHHFAEHLGDQQRRGERNERSPFGCPSFCVASVPPEATEFDVRFGGYRLAYSIERCHDGRMVAFSWETNAIAPARSDRGAQLLTGP
jgi:hypothetical protein